MYSFSQKSSFFNLNNYFIDEKVNLFKFENCYSILNAEGTKIGSVNQKLTFGQKFLRLLIKKSMLPFLLEIKNSDDELQASISRDWTLFLSKIEIKNAQGELIGTIKQKFQLFSPKFLILDTTDTPVAEISGDWTAWEFSIRDVTKSEIGVITKKWAGPLKEIFTTADKYMVEIHETYTNLEHRAIIISAAITIDMVLKESK
jgi:uncharacterized protein YxjI